MTFASTDDFQITIRLNATIIKIYIYFLTNHAFSVFIVERNQKQNILQLN